jgi:hypothetical protein
VSNNINMRNALPLLFVAFLTPAFSQPDRTSGAVLAGFTEETIENDGQIARLDIVTRVRVTIAGAYSLTLNLTASDGRNLTGRTRRILDAGDHFMTVSFAGEAIKSAFTQNGPYSIADARLTLEVDAKPEDAMLVVSSAALGSTKAYGLVDFYEPPYALTGEFEAEGIDIRPTGKFGLLRVRFGVRTPGANCSASAMLKDQRGAEIDFENSTSSPPLPPGRGFIELVFPGPKIVAHGIEGPFVIPGITIGCRRTPDNRPGNIETRTEFRTPAFRVSDFDTPADFELSLYEASYRVPAGATVPARVLIRMIGLSEEPVALQLHSPEAKLQFTNPLREFTCTTCYQPPVPEYFSIQIPDDLTPGTYTIEVTGRRNGQEHTIQFPVNVDADWTRQLQEYRKTLTDLVRPDSPAVAPPNPVVSADNDLPETQLDAKLSVVGPFGPPTRFSLDLSLRKIHAVLVTERSRAYCELAKASAVRFSRLLVEGRDSLSIISFSASAQIVLPLSDRYPIDLEDRLKKIPCGRLGNNTGAAMQLAYQQLKQNHDPDAIDVVILMTFSTPLHLTAAWPTNKQPDGSACLESRDGRVTAIVWPRYIVTEIYPRREAGPSLLPEDFPDPFPTDDLVRLDQPNSCFGTGLRRVQDAITSIPERDADGISLTGSFPLERWPTGPHADEIRIDKEDNLLNAAANQVENIAKEIRSQPESAFVYAIGAANPVRADAPRVYSAWPESLRRITNDPQGSSFKPDQPAGMAIMIDKAEAVWPAFERIRRDILDHATVK